MEKKNNKNSKMIVFLKKNVYYIIMALCIIAIATMITVSVVNKNKAGNPDLIIDNNTPVITPDDKPVNKPDTDLPTVVFVSPVETVNVVFDYSMDVLVWNNSINRYAVHTGIDFGGKDGDKVMCVLDGTVQSVGYDFVNGYTVTIKHADDLVTSYASLNEPIVKVGDVLKKGQEIGTMGNTAGNEYNLGSHVHFSTLKAGKIVNPYDYLPSMEK